jgi:hypothetical protein
VRELYRSTRDILKFDFDWTSRRTDTYPTPVLLMPTKNIPSEHLAVAGKMERLSLPTRADKPLTRDESVDISLKYAIGTVIATPRF